MPEIEELLLQTRDLGYPERYTVLLAALRLAQHFADIPAWVNCEETERLAALIALTERFAD